MSIAALNWAIDQKTDGPSAQSVLWLIADRANEHGICRHADPDTIAQKTRQSRATVFRRLEEAERVGIIARFVRHLDDGRREYEVRLAMQRYVNYRVDKYRNITLYALDDDKCEGDPIGFVPFDGGAAQDIDGESQIETQDGSQFETAKVSPVRLGESQSCDSQKSPSKNPKDSPQPPLRGVTQAPSGDQGSEDSEAPDPDGWADFKAAWEGDKIPIARVSICKPIFAALTADERIKVTKAAKGYLAHRARDKKPGTKMSAQNFLREPEAWEGWAQHAPAEPAPPKPQAIFPMGSPEFMALVLARTIARLPPLRADTSALTFKGDVPKGAEGLAALLTYRIGAVTIDVDQSGWQLFAKNSDRYVAWCQRVQEWIGFWPEDHRYWLNAAGEVVATVQQAEGYGDKSRLPKCCDGLLLPPTPDGWPPRKDGTIPQPTEQQRGE